MQDHEREDLLDDVADVDSRCRCSSILHFLAEPPAIVRRDLLKEPVSPGRHNVAVEDRPAHGACTVSHTRFLNQRSPNSPKLLASFKRRFCRCFSCAGEIPSPTMRRASRHHSLAGEGYTYLLLKSVT